MPPRIKIDLDLCQGHGVCQAEAPRHFEVDEDRSKVRIIGDVLGSDRSAAERAVRNCPTGALSIEDED